MQYYLFKTYLWPISTSFSIYLNLAMEIMRVTGRKQGINNNVEHYCVYSKNIYINTILKVPTIRLDFSAFQVNHTFTMLLIQFSLGFQRKTY